MADATTALIDRQPAAPLGGCCSAARGRPEAPVRQHAAPASDDRGECAPPVPGDAVAVDFTAYVGRDDAGRSVLHLLVEGIHCGGCVAKIERALRRSPGVEDARVNLTTRRLVVAWRGPAEQAARHMAAITDLGYRVVPYDPQRARKSEARDETELLRAMAVAGFAAGNIMLLSVSVWAGHFQDMGPATRDLLHWFSAIVAIPAIFYAGRPFFRSALTALRHGRTNMDVPISLGVLLATAMSLHETAVGGPHAYFDSAVTLLFFLLVGRYLDRRARGQARSAAERLLSLRANAVAVLDTNGTVTLLPPEQVRPGMVVLVAAGARIPVDGRVLDGRSDIDTSLITGETLPVTATVGDTVFAGTLNQSGPLRLEVTAVGTDTLLGEIVRLMEATEQRKARYVSLADRVARLYAPVVHLLALATFVGWAWALAAPWQVALLNAVAVLIITCPCALGLAVPVVQVIASGRLMRQGILLKSATALERLAVADTIVFDKTGTLTTGRPELLRDERIDASDLALAASLAAASRHPLARALVRAVPDASVADGVVEVAGHGLSRATPEGEVRLGSRRWCGVAEDAEEGAAAGPEMWLTRPGRPPVRFAFADALRPDAASVVARLKALGFEVELLSGDREAVVSAVAAAVGIDRFRASCTPVEKCDRLAALAAAGRKVLMVGDGLNDAPALAAALVSVSPSSAADVSQTAADAVFQGERLHPVLELLTVSQRVERLVRQNFALAFGYNVLTIPVAVMGLVTPLIAAICMSASSLVVVGNSFRLARRRSA